MHEPLTTSLIVELITKLNIAFPRSRAGDNQTALVDVYRNALRGVSGDGVREAVDRCIEREEFFPKVSKIRAIAAAYDKQRYVSMIQRGGTDPDQCPICFARTTYHATPNGERGVMVHDSRGHGIFENNEAHVA